jgi:putative transposase
LSERRACRLVNQQRGTQRYQPTQREDEDALTQAIIDAASQYGRYGYRRITAVLRDDGWHVGKDRVERIWTHDLCRHATEVAVELGYKMAQIASKLGNKAKV